MAVLLFVCPRCKEAGNTIAIFFKRKLEEKIGGMVVTN